MACLTLALCGSTAAQVAPLPTQGAFAPPWAVSFQHIRDAMHGKHGAYAIEQVRRGFETRLGAGTRFVGTNEALLYLPADPANRTPERFKIEFRGIEGRQLTAPEFARLAALFDGKSGFTFRYKGFHVADPVLAAKIYDLVFLAHGQRATNHGTVPVYRMAVLPKSWDRTAWLLELDTATGYPLYAGEYSFDAGNNVKLQSEVIVHSFLSGVRTPHANDPSWWSPIRGIEATKTAQDALKKALTQSQTYVTPSLTELPAGFELAGAEVHTDPFRGNRSAVLRYTDGIDHLFVTERNIPVAPRAADDTIAFLEVDGVTRCAFSHRGVSFDVIGRKAAAVRSASVGIYSRAILLLN